MRTTIDLPDDLHRQARAIARDSNRSMSETVSELLRRALTGAAGEQVTSSTVTGLPVLTLGAVLTTEDVRALEDQE